MLFTAVLALVCMSLAGTGITLLGIAAFVCLGYGVGCVFMAFGLDQEDFEGGLVTLSLTGPSVLTLFPISVNNYTGTISIRSSRD